MGFNHAVHSTWFGVLAETGFLSLLIFIIIIWKLLRSAARSARIISETYPLSHPMVPCSQALFAGLMGTMISGTFLTHGFTWPIYIYIIIAMDRWVKDPV